jgi:hypothetical protein
MLFNDEQEVPHMQIRIIGAPMDLGAELILSALGKKIL